MHFSIPDTEEVVGSDGKAFTNFNIHVNGVFHCAARYSVLHAFYKELEAEFGPSMVGSFPSKKLLSLTDGQLNERRKGIESFIQGVSQEDRIARSTTFTQFLMNAQKEVQRECIEVTVEIYLVNGKKTTVNCLSTDQTDEVLEQVCAQIGLAEDFTYYFALYMIEDDEATGRYRIVRKLQDFESPYISLTRSAKPNQKIQMQKAFWDTNIDKELYNDSIALNLLYTQALIELKNGDLLATEEERTQLLSYKDKGSKKEFLKLARMCKGYGSAHFHNVVCDFPEPGVKCSVMIGTGGVVIRSPEKGECVFSVTRIRCWKISGSFESGLELSFDYLRKKDLLMWTKLDSQDAIYMSMCLQAIVSEMVRLKKGDAIRKPRDRPKRIKPTPTARAPSTSGDDVTPASSAAPSPQRPASSASASATVSPSTSSSMLPKQAGAAEKKEKPAAKGKSKTPSTSSGAAPAIPSGFNSAFNTEFSDNDKVFAGIGDDDL